MYANDKRRAWLDMLPLILTAFIAGATCYTAYLTYKSVQISAAQERRESRQEIMQLLTLVRETLESANRLAESKSASASSSGETTVSNNQIQPTADASAD